jgi:rhamnogalacturonan acetylesterase
MRHIRNLLVAFVLTACSTAFGQTTKPTLFLIGDSTVKNGTKGQQGWGTSLPAYFDESKIRIANHAIGGRSSRTFFTEGRWEKVMAELKPGDFVLMQFGHNDGTNPKNDPKGRGSIRGVGDETVEVTKPDGSKETVHTFGWYLKQYVKGAREKGATPVVLSLVPRNDWKDGKVLRADKSYGKYARDVAEAEKAPFIDLNELVASRYEQLGEEKVKAFFPHEHTHTNVEGADVNAQCVVEGIKSLKDVPLKNYLRP